MYTTKICAYCVRAKALLQRLGIPYEERDATTDPDTEVLMRKHGHFTVPMIFVDEVFVGGFDELNRRQKELLG
jgi:glutaredoxin